MAHFLQKEYFENEKEFAEDQACSLGETNFDFWNMFMAFVLLNEKISRVFNLFYYEASL